MSNSPLVEYVKISPNKNSPRKDKIKKITIHHMAGNLSVETCGNIFASKSRQASSNYGIDSAGKVGMYVEEKDRAWTSSNADNDHQAITIEVANNGGAPNWPVSDKALATLIDLCVDICKRNGIERLDYTGNKKGNLTRHNMFAATTCPGPYLQSKFTYIAEEVNKRLSVKTTNNDKLYRVQTGAFKHRDNADRLAAKLKKDGYDTYIVVADGLYKVQTGAFAKQENATALAKKLKAAGYDVYITTKSGQAAAPPKPEPKPTIKVGSKVKVKQGAKTYTGTGLAGFVYKNVYDVIEVKGNRVVIGEGRVVTAAVHKDNLILQK